MKKVISFVLALSMVFALCGCGGQKQPEKPDAVKNVERLIDAIGEVSLDREKYITDAESAYNNLYEVDKEQVENYSLLVEAKTQYGLLIEAEIETALKLSEDEETVSEARTTLEKLNERIIDESQIPLIQAAFDRINLCYYEGTCYKKYEALAEQGNNGPQLTVSIEPSQENSIIFHYDASLEYEEWKEIDSLYTAYLEEHFEKIYADGTLFAKYYDGTTYAYYLDALGNRLAVLHKWDLVSKKGFTLVGIIKES